MASESTHPNFTLLAEHALPELASHGWLYRHEPTGAELLSIANTDENKVFGMTFRTPPADSTGVAHILEHSVLCGSARFPVKEPFVELMKGSLNTFVNAMTYPDKTCYPVASQNLHDYYNLIDVYVDAVLHPLITPQTLQQEGWHYELDGPDGPLFFKGVVFNEMKGAYSSPEGLLRRHVEASLYPDTPYGQDAGGDPAHIPDLTYAAFKTFHERYYHPSNARIFFYGDDEPAERLRRMDAYLAGFDRQPVDSAVPRQAPFSAPRRVVAYYQGDDSAPQDDEKSPQDRESALHDDETSSQDRESIPQDDRDLGGSHRKSMVVVAWLLPEVGDPELMLALQILEYLLIGNPTAPLYKALLDSGLGEDLAGQGLEDQLRQMFLCTGLKGAAAADADAIEALVVATLVRLAGDGFDPDALTAAVNAVEFQLREQNTGQFPRGLAQMLNALTIWLHDGDPFRALAFEAPLQSIKHRLAHGEPVFEDLIRRHFLANPHRVTVVLHPSSTVAAAADAAERARLDAARASLTAQALAQVETDQQALKMAQETPDTPAALATIPRLTRADLDREARQIPTAHMQLAGVPILFHDLPTNGILYLDLGFDLHTLPPEHLPYVPLFGRALLELGAAGMDPVKFAQRIDSLTGGIRPVPYASVVRGAPAGASAARLFLRAKAVVERTGDLLSILSDCLSHAELDNQARFGQLIMEEKAGLEAALVPVGHQMVARRLRAHFNEADWLVEGWRGVSQLFFLRQLADQAERDWPGVLAILQSIQAALVNRQAVIVNATVDVGAWEGEVGAGTGPVTGQGTGDGSGDRTADGTGDRTGNGIVNETGQAGVAERLAGFLAALPDRAPDRHDWRGARNGRPSNRHPATAAPGPDPAVVASNGHVPLAAEGLVIPAAVNYVGKTADLSRLGLPVDGTAIVVDRYLRTTWLWDRVRVQGGAYGGFSIFDPRSGLMTFLSYRDPNLLATLNVYDGSGAFLRGLAISDDELTKAVIGAISDMDTHLLPDAKGFTALDWYLAGEDKAVRQQRRDQVLATTAADFRRFADLLDAARDHSLVAVMGSATAIEAAAAEAGAFGDGLQVTKVM